MARCLKKKVIFTEMFDCKYLCLSDIIVVDEKIAQSSQYLKHIVTKLIPICSSCQAPFTFLVVFLPYLAPLTVVSFLQLAYTACNAAHHNNR